MNWQAASPLPGFLQDLDPHVFLSDNYLALDVETTNLDKGTALNNHNALVLAVWWTPKEGWDWQWGTELDMGRLVRAIEAADFIVAHNAKFELQWLKRCGVQLEDVLAYCTQIGEVVKFGNLLARRRRDQSLERTAKRYKLGVKDSLVSKMIKAGVCPSLIPRPWLWRYCMHDVRLAREVFVRQRQKLKESGKLAVQYTRCLTTSVLADVEFNGLFLDKERVLEEWTKYHTSCARLLREMDEFTGGINPRSSVQVAEFLYDVLKFDEKKDYRGEPIRTPGGARCTSEKVLSTLTAKTPQQRKFLKLKKELGKSQSALSKSLDFFKGVVDERGGLFHGQFHQTNTATHRLASTGRKQKFEQFPKPKTAQLQNLAVIFKRLFRARHEGWLFGEVDGSQLEFRVAAYLGQDRAAHDDIASRVDVHARTRDIIFPNAKDPSKARHNAKPHTFKPLYGGTSGTARQRKYYQHFKEIYPDITRTQREWVTEVVKNKRLVTVTGLTFYWPTTQVYQSGFVENSQAIHNYPVQNLATAEMVLISLVYFWHRLKRTEGAQMFVVNTVHDSIEAEFPPEEKELFLSLSRQTFSSDLFDYLEKVYGIKWNVPLGMGAKIASHWGEGEEITENFDPPYQMEEKG